MGSGPQDTAGVSERQDHRRRARLRRPVLGPPWLLTGDRKTLARWSSTSLAPAARGTVGSCREGWFPPSPDVVRGPISEGVVIQPLEAPLGSKHPFRGPWSGAAPRTKAEPQPASPVIRSSHVR